MAVSTGCVAFVGSERRANAAPRRPLQSEPLAYRIDGHLPGGARRGGGLLGWTLPEPFGSLANECFTIDRKARPGSGCCSYVKVSPHINTDIYSDANIRVGAGGHSDSGAYTPQDDCSIHANPRASSNSYTHPDSNAKTSSDRHAGTRASTTVSRSQHVG